MRDWLFATLARCQYTFTLYVVKECLLVQLVNEPETEIILVSQHLSAP